MTHDWRDELNKEQLRAVTHEGGPLLVLAGAGSGKTRVLTYRACWLIKEKGVDPKKIILLTFTNKAAQEMSGRVKSLLQTQDLELEGVRLAKEDHPETQPAPEKRSYRSSGLGFAGTFHGFCVRLLRRYGQKIGIKNEFAIYDAADQKQVMKKVLNNLGQEQTTKNIRMYLAMISKYKNNLMEAEDARFLGGADYQRSAIRVWREYQRLLGKFNALDFDDLLTRCVSLLRVKEVRSKIHERFDWVLVDEYQDTNKAQFELTRLLVDDPGRLTVVGDASQAIYSFRGADFRNLKLLKRYFKDLKIAELLRNYRSTQSILDAAHKVIDNNTGHPILKLRADGDAGDKIVLFEGKDGRTEARFVVDNCVKAMSRGEDIAILYRTNAQSRILEEELIKARIAYRLVGGVRFYERKEIKDLLAYLKVIVNPDDAVAWERIEKLGKRRRARFEAWLESRPVREMSTGELMKGVLESTGYLDRFDKKLEEDLGRLENIDELLAVTSEFAKVEAFLESVALIQAEDLADRLQPKETQVTLMTIHSAKGLEFDNVCIVGLEEGLLPHSRSLLEQDALEEERRLLYVAITRARRRLFLSFAGSRFLYGGRSKQLPSRFLSEIPSHLICREKASLVSKKFQGRRIVQDWEVEKESKSDFDEIDNW